MSIDLVYRSWDGQLYDDRPGWSLNLEDAGRLESRTSVWLAVIGNRLAGIVDGGLSRDVH